MGTNALLRSKSLKPYKLAVRLIAQIRESAAERGCGDQTRRSFCDLVERRPHPEQSVVQAPSAIRERALWVNGAAPRRPALLSEKQCAFVPIDGRQIGVIMLSFPAPVGQSYFRGRLIHDLGLAPFFGRINL